MVIQKLHFILSSTKQMKISKSRNIIKKIDELDKSLDNNNKEKVLSIVAELVPDWKRYKGSK